MKILVNASTCVVGGGVQVATSFITHALEDRSGERIFLFAISPQVNQNLPHLCQFDKRFKVVSPSPARPLKGRESRRLLLHLEKSFQPDIVFTIFGPSYLRFRTLHLCGFADSWVTHRSKVATKSLPLIRRIRTLAVCQYKRLQLPRKDYYWVETEAVRKGLIALLRIDPSHIRVIPNSYASIFLKTRGVINYNNCKKDTTSIFCLAAPYPHKNLIIIPEVAHILKNRCANRPYRFVVTLPSNGAEVKKFWEKAKHLQVTDIIENIGPLILSDCPKWYSAADVIFLPTLLESFSATYLEAMVMGKPIVTTDLDFAHDICGNAAAYYDPLSPEEAAKAIMRVVEDHSYRMSLIENGKIKLSQYPTPEQKYRLLLDWIDEIVKSTK